MSCNLYWAQNDGIGGHVWLSERDVLALVHEMVAQGMAWETEPAAGIPSRKLVAAVEERIGAEEIEAALQLAASEPRTLSDRRLWTDWLAFLDGATRRGGIVVRP